MWDGLGTIKDDFSTPPPGVTVDEEGETSFDGTACVEGITTFDGFRADWGELTEDGQTAEMGDGITEVFCAFIDVTTPIRLILIRSSIFAFVTLLFFWAKGKIAAFSGTNDGSASASEDSE
jgi:hypothetical protein